MADSTTDTYMMDQIICPYCGKQNRNNTEWDVDFGPVGEGDTELDCSDCGKEFSVHNHISVSYSTFKSEGK